MSEEIEETKRHLKEMKEIAQHLGDKLHEMTNYYVKTTDELNKYKDKLQQKENIIKEVREYVEHKASIRECYMINGKEYKELLEILDKGE